MECAPGLENACPNALSGVSSQLFLTLINTLMASQCSLGPEGRYPPNYGPNLSDGDEFDFIVVGAGSSGAVVANRLTEVEDWKVLLIEAGGNPSAVTEIPALLYMLQGTEEDWKYVTEPSTTSGLSLKEQRTTASRGKVIGGSSALNAMVYIRGHREDFDIWAAKGNEGWDYDSVLKYFKKSVNARESLTQPNYGKGGYLTVSSYENEEPFVNILHNAYKEIGHEDYTEDKPTGFLRSPMTIVNGTRCSTGKAFISPIKDRKNLYVATHAQVARVLFDAKTKMATGVEVKVGNKLLKVKAKKEVVLSAGSTNSPQILMNSGIGPKEHLEELGIPLLQNLRVGENLQDHVLFTGITVSLDASAVPELHAQHLIDELYRYFMYREGSFATIGITNNFGYMKINNDSKSPDIQFFHEIFPKNQEEVIREMLRGSRTIQEIVEAEVEHNKQSAILKFYPTLLKPKSRGRVLLRSSDPFDIPLIFADFLSDANNEDLEVMLESVKHVKKLVATKAMAEHGAKILDNKIPNCKGYTFDTDDYWRCALRNLGTTIFHPVGTCKMGPVSDSSAVVDSQLRVHGIQSLRVIDGSIMPNVVSINTNPACIMIGEKGSDLIKEEWGRKQHEEL